MYAQCFIAETDASKEKIIQTLNFHCYNDASPFYSLPLKTLLQIYKTTQKDKKDGFCENRLYYISNKIKVMFDIYLDISFKLYKVFNSFI